MSGFVKIVTRALSRILLGAVFLGAPLMSFADDVIPDELRLCSTIDDSSARLACYDAYSGRQAPAQTLPSASSEPTADQALDDLGSETLRRDADEKEEELAVRATVTGCKKDAREKYMFFFDNGQVWRQSNDKRVYFRDCEFAVTITKDVFGYKMQRDGDKGRIRISRVK